MARPMALHFFVRLVFDLFFYRYHLVQSQERANRSVCNCHVALVALLYAAVNAQRNNLAVVFEVMGLLSLSWMFRV